MNNKKQIKTVVIISILLFLQFNLYPLEKNNLDLKKFRKVWTSFLIYPSKENIKKVNDILSYKTINNINIKVLNKKLKSKLYEDTQYTFNNLYNDIWVNIDLLAKEAYSGNKIAIKVFFKLYLISECKNKENIVFILGNLIRIKPEIFLEEMKGLLNSENKRKDMIFMDILTKYGSYYENNFEYELFETRMRIKSLKSVKNNSLKKIRNKGIEIVKRKEVELTKKVTKVNMNNIVKFVTKYRDYLFTLLGKEVYSANRKVFKRFFIKCTEYESEPRYGLNFIFVNLIRINPKVFLEELKNYKSVLKDSLKWMVGFLDPGFYADRLRSRIRETKFRIISLESVKDKSLQRIKDECLDILKKKEKKYLEILEYEKNNNR